MRRLIYLFLILTSGFSMAEVDNDFLLLRLVLKESLVVVSETEVRYCPDNTCEVYKIVAPHEHFEAFVYLHLFYRSKYVYFELDKKDSNSLRGNASQEFRVRSMLSSYCETDDINCILDNAQKALTIETGFSRYDEGFYCSDFILDGDGCLKL